MLKLQKAVAALTASVITVGAAYALEGPFVPPDGKQLMVIGQDTISIDDYRNHVGVEPAGVTTYISLSDLGGLTNGVDNGGGPNNAGYLQQQYPNSIHAIAVYLVNQLGGVNSGAYDGQMDQLINTLKSWERPVLLRWGYEADGAWNGYDPGAYVQAFQKMSQKVEQAGADNIAMVWQVASYCGGTYGGRAFTDWYPGDQYVDWLAFSYFTPQDCNNSAIDSFMNFARSKNKPVMIAESASQRYDIQVGTYNSCGNRCAADQQKSSEQIWNEWFVNYFNYIDQHKDLIKVAAYINADWDSQSLWAPPYGMGYWGDTRVQESSLIRDNWISEITKANWLPASPTLFSTLALGSTTTGTDTDTSTDTGSSTQTDTDTDTGTDTGVTSEPIRIEVESTTISAPAETYRDGAASGGAGVAYIYQPGAGFEFNFSKPMKGLSIRYASMNSGTITVVTNSKTHKVPFNSTGSWTGNYQSIALDYQHASETTIRIQFESGDAAMNIDYVEVLPDAGDTSTATDTSTDTSTAVDPCIPEDIPDALVTYSNETKLGLSNGSISFDFDIAQWREGVQFSIDGGVTYSGTQTVSAYTIGDLAPGNYVTYARWENGECPTLLETVTIAEGERPADDTDLAFGLEADGTLYHKDGGHTGGFVYLCINGGCYSASKNGDRYEYQTGITSGSHNIEFKIQDNSVGQCIATAGGISPGKGIAESNCF